MSGAGTWIDLELEQMALVDAVTNRRFEDYAARIDAEDFSDRQYGLVFQAGCGLVASGSSVSYSTIRGYLADRGLLDSLVQAAVNDTFKGGVRLDVQQACERLRALRRRRELRDDLQGALRELEDAPDRVDGGFAARLCEQLLSTDATLDPGKSRRPMTSGVDAIDEWLSKPARSEYQLPLGIVPTIDRLMQGGLEPGECLFNLARPGSLKTMLQLNILRGWVTRWRDAFFVLVELEMPKRQLMERLARMHFRLTWEALEDRRRGGGLDVEAFKAALGGLYVIDDVGLTLSDIEHRIRLRARELAPLRLGGVVIDHCGLVRASQGGTSAYDRATETAIGLKQMARRLEAPVVAIVQANRTAAQSSRSGDPPEMEHARDSGAYEENADFMLSMSAIQKQGAREYVTVRLAKNRRGAAYTANVGFDPVSLRMAELDDRGDFANAA